MSNILGNVNKLIRNRIRTSPKMRGSKNAKKKNKWLYFFSHTRLPKPAPCGTLCALFSLQRKLENICLFTYSHIHISGRESYRLDKIKNNRPRKPETAECIFTVAGISEPNACCGFGRKSIGLSVIIESEQRSSLHLASSCWEKVSRRNGSHAHFVLLLRCRAE